MRAEVFEDIGTYIYRQKNTVAQYIATCPNLDLCMDTDRRPGSWTPTRQWQKEGLVLLGILSEGGESGYGIGDEEELVDEDQRKDEAEGIIQQCMNNREVAQYFVSLFSGYVTPPPNIEHVRGSWRPDKREILSYSSRYDAKCSLVPWRSSNKISCPLSGPSILINIAYPGMMYYSFFHPSCTLYHSYKTLSASKGTGTLRAKVILVTLLIIFRDPGENFSNHSDLVGDLDRLPS